MKIIKILKEIEQYYVVLSYMFIGFFIAITGVTIIPLIAESASEGSLTPLFYAISIMFGCTYFAYYKVAKIICKIESKGGKKK